MRCEESRQLIDFYLDGELDALRAAEFELHVRGCGECTPQIERASKLRSAIREAAPYFAAPPALKSRIREALRAANGNKSQAARLLGLSRNALRYRLTKIGISDEPAEEE